MKKNILIVDDDIDTLQLVGTMLEQKNYKILAADNGEKALQIAEKENIDLVILDVMMPGIDGFEITRRMRANEKTSLIPIILFSAKVQIDDKMAGYEAGADAYITKPTHPKELISTVISVLEKHDTNNKVGTKFREIKDQHFAIGILSTKGGLGVSNFALNLSIAIQQYTEENVTLAEFRPGQGSIGMLIDQEEIEGINNLLQYPFDEIKTSDVKEEIIRDFSGIQLLLSSYKSSPDLNLDYSNHLEVISKKIRNSGDYTIFDLGPGLSATTKKVIINCQSILIVTEPFAWTIKQTKDLVNTMLLLGINEKAIKIVLITKYRSQNNLPTSEVQKELGREIDFIITPSPEDIFTANSRKLPISTLLPNSIYSKQISKISKDLLMKEKKI